MNPEFWRERWQRNEIGFHQARPHAALAAHWDTLGLAKGARVFVPLAGKSLDMVWLAQAGFRVVGVELAAEAVAAFRAENPAWADRIDLRAMDLFDLTREALGPVDAVFDRAALVALPPAMRERYARHLSTLTTADCQTLLVTMEYDQTRMAGPPHSVLEDEVRALYGADHDVQVLERNAALEDFPKFAQRGVSALAECTYRLRRRQPHEL